MCTRITKYYTLFFRSWIEKHKFEFVWNLRFFLGRLVCCEKITTIQQVSSVTQICFTRKCISTFFLALWFSVWQELFFSCHNFLTFSLKFYARRRTNSVFLLSILIESVKTRFAQNFPLYLQHIYSRFELCRVLIL